VIKCEPLKKVSTLALFFCVVIACKQSAAPHDSTILKSSDGKAQLTVPEGWTSGGPLKSDQLIKAVNESSGAAVIVSFESRADLADGITLDKYADITRNNLLTKGFATDATAPSPLTLNGSQARQYEAKITRDNGKYIFLVTLIEAPDRFYMINAAVPPSKYDENRAAFKEISGSFRAAQSPSNSNEPSSH
jgi:predicted Zn-dependent protease